MLRSFKPLVWGLALAIAGACQAQHHEQSVAVIKEAIAVVHGTKGNEKVTGTVRFTAVDHGLKVVAHIEGLTPNGEHGFHIHEFGDCSAPDASSAGSHYNPGGHQHGKPGDASAHVGDMGNLKADDKGVANLEVTLPTAALQGPNSILGRSIIVHAKPDDFSQPVGNAGPRIGCGIIGIAQVKK